MNISLMKALCQYSSKTCSAQTDLKTLAAATVIFYIEAKFRFANVGNPRNRCALSVVLSNTKLPFEEK